MYNKKSLALILGICLAAQSLSAVCFADAENGNTPSDSGSAGIPDIIAVNTKTTDEITEQYCKGGSSASRGFAGGRGSILSGKIKGKNTQSDDGAAVSAGAVVNRNGKGENIQYRYFPTVQECIGSSFTADGGYKYYDKKTGKISPLEVPADQYGAAIYFMKEKISQGCIPGVTDQESAVLLVKKGALMYQQAKNLAAYGTINSLAYDGESGTVYTDSQLGINTVVNYAVCVMNGESSQDALRAAAYEKYKAVSTEYGINAETGHITKRDSFSKSNNITADDVIDSLSDSYESYVLADVNNMYLSESLGISDKSCSIINNAINLVVSECDDAKDLFQKRISNKQFFINFASNTAKATINYGLDQKSGIIGGTVGGAAADIGVDYVIGKIPYSDADEMYKIIQDTFAQKCSDYLLNQKETDDVLAVIEWELANNSDKFKDMYQSRDRVLYAERLIEPWIIAEISQRPVIETPSDGEMRKALLSDADVDIRIH